MAAKGTPEDARVLPPGVDDFTKITGIKFGIEKRFHDAEIFTYAQLASMSPQEIVNAIGPMVGLTVDRVTRQDWIGQAIELAEQHQQISTDTVPDESDRQHYASFTVELLLDEQNRVRRTKLKEVLYGNEMAWIGWDAQKLTDFMIEEGNLKIEQIESEPEPDLSIQKPALPISGKLVITEIALKSMNGHTVRPSNPHNKPFKLTIGMDIKIEPSEFTNLDSFVTVTGKRLGTEDRIVIGEARQRVETSEHLDLELVSPGLPTGTYRIEAAAKVNSPGNEEAGLSAFLEGSLLQFY
jgi:hypothetical protein